MTGSPPQLFGTYPVRLWVSAGLAVAGLYDIAYIVKWDLNSPQPPFGDFFGLWSFGRFAKDFGSTVYNPFALANYQHELDPEVNGSYPFPYPPTFLLALIPLGLLKLPVAYSVWIATTFIAYVLATVGRTWRSIYGFSLLVAPTTLLTIISGQNGLLSAALIAGGLNNLKARPILAGTLLGLLIYKPQFALLPPVILAASRSIDAMLAFGCTIAATILITSAIFGWSIWPCWIGSFPLYQHLLQANQHKLAHLMPTVLAGMHSLGAPAVAGYILQFTVSLTVALLCWRAVSHGITARAIAMSIIGSLLVAPYALVYDTPMIASAILLHWRSRIRDGYAIGVWEIALVMATFSCFFRMLTVSVPLLAPLQMLAIFLVITFSPNGSRAHGVESRLNAA